MSAIGHESAGLAPCGLRRAVRLRSATRFGVPGTLRLRLAAALVAGVLAGCAAPPPAGDAAAAASNAPGLETSSADVERLVALSRERASAGDDDYPIGPGDLIAISSSAVAEIRDVTVRVAPDGTISLPLLGTLPAGGRTEGELRDVVHAALEEYMYQPEFSLWVKEYRNRHAGVLGAVASPGLHPIDDGNDTVLDMLSKAGGLTDEATRRLLFIPATELEADARRLASAEPVALDAPHAGEAAASDGALPRAARPIVIDLDGMDQPTQQLALSIPVRPGDTIMVLGGGKVFLRGWVDKPGAYDMSRGLTVLQLVTQAGGFSFPAEEDSVRILREQPGSNAREAIVVDVAAIQAGEGEDVPVREGDVVEIPATPGKLAVYGVYQFVTGLIRASVGLALTPF